MSGRLLSPSSIAIVGVSADATKHGARVLANLRKLGFDGTVWGVNPKRPDVAGIDVFASVADLPEPPDLVVFATPGHAVPATLRAASGAGYAIVFAGGFAETGAAGRALQQELTEAAVDSGVRVLGPNSGGVIAPGSRLAASFLTCLDRPAAEIRPGPVGLVTQSGGTGSYLHNLAAARGSGFAASISTGNEADFDVAAGISTLVAIAEVKVIAVVLETVRNGPDFLAAARHAATARKPIVVTRLGTGERSGTMITSHTGALATPTRVFDGIARTLGISVAETPQEMLDIAEVLARTSKPAGDRVGIVTHSGGIAILLSDLAEQAGLILPPPSPQLIERLTPLLQQGSSHNPLDMGGIIGGPHRFGEVVRAFGSEYDTVLAVSTAHPPGHTEARVQSLLELRIDAPVVHLWMAGDVSQHGLEELRAADRPVTEEPRAAIKALATLTKPAPELAPAVAGKPACARAEDGAPSMTEFEGKALLRDAGIPVVDGAVAQTADEAVAHADALGYPAVAKLNGRGAIHKTELGGVMLGLAGGVAVRTAFDVIMAIAGEHPDLDCDGVLIERMVPIGPEAAIGAVSDPVFGEMVLVGIGGIAVEVWGDVAMAPAPVTTDQARAMIESLRGLRLLTHPRQGSPADLTKLTALVQRVSQLAVELPSPYDIDINPLIWSGDAWLAVDALFVPSSGAPR